MTQLANNPTETARLANLRISLREFASDRLTSAMMPTRFVIVPELPKLPNGKVDRGRLPENGVVDLDFVLPQDADIATPAHSKAVELWGQLLGVDGLGVDDDFFDLGGNSLLAVEMAAKWTLYSGATFDLAPFLIQPTIRQLVKLTVTISEIYESNDPDHYAELPPDIQPAGTHASWPPRAALVTGSVIAVDVIQELLAQDVSTIYLLTSAHTTTRARDIARITSRSIGNIDRIFTKTGDITRPYLGMAINQYRKLAAHVDLVVHTHIENSPTDAFIAQEIIRFAVTEQTKTVKYIRGSIPNHYVQQAVERCIPLSIYETPEWLPRSHVNNRYVITDHVISAPLNYRNPEGPTIELFAQEVVAAGKENAKLPYLLFLQGGPGGRAPTPGNASSAWIDGALETHRVILLDQRGTGRSSPLTNESLSNRRDEEIVSLIHHHRADAIVADAERLRSKLIGNQPWTLLGQSYGGFIALTYLSHAPEGVSGAIISGGLPGLDSSLDNWYNAQIRGMLDKNTEYYDRYPEDIQRVAALVNYLNTNCVTLPDGSRLTSRRLRRLGLYFGMSDGYERTHSLIAKGWDGRRITDDFRQALLAETGFATGPLYALQEFIHAGPACVTQWAAERALKAFPEYEEFPTKFYGEFMFPWMFQEVAHLQRFTHVANLLANDSSFSDLYDRDRLQRNTVPILAIAYEKDVYSPLIAQKQTAAYLGDCQLIVSTQHHNSLMRSATMAAKLLSDLQAQIDAREMQWTR